MKLYTESSSTVKNTFTLNIELSVVFVLSFLLMINPVQAQDERYYDEDVWAPLLDSLKTVNKNKVSESGDRVELAANIALLYYPKLKTNRIKIKYKKNVQHPITASWSFWNIFKIRRWHTYVLLIKPNSFIDRISLNKQVGLVGHEMAHFAYYKKRPSIAMAWWGLKYVTSRKFRYAFERGADQTAIDQGLGWQLLDMSIYMRRFEVQQYMRQSGKYQSQ
ncbi:MAG: hypothetical protein AAFX87_13285 [Bacteroidota bacterium]